MGESITISSNIREELIKLTNKDNTLEAIIDLIKSEIFRKRNKYEYLDKHFREKYNQNFDEFEKKYTSGKMSYEIEKDYFDWDMAVTILEDIDDELKGL